MLLPGLDFLLDCKKRQVFPRDVVLFFAMIKNIGKVTRVTLGF